MTTPRSRRRVASAAARIAPALAAMTVGAWFAFETSVRGWTTPSLAAVSGAALAALCALLGRTMRRPALERAAPFIAVVALVIGVLGALQLRLRG